MPKITKGGVSDRLVDPDYMAPPGTPVADALDRGLPDAGKPQEEDSPSPGTNSSASSGKPKPTTNATKSDGKTRSSAPSTDGPSTTGRRGNSTAGSAGTSSGRRK